MTKLIDSATAAQILGVKPQTLYAYVARGKLQAHKQTGSTRSWFDPVEVDALLRYGRSTHSAPKRPDVVMESAITLIAEGRYWYRGHSPFDLATTSYFEQVAELLWTTALPPTPSQWLPSSRSEPVRAALARALGDDTSTTDYLRAAVPLLSSADPLRHDLRPEAIAVLGPQLLADLVAILPRQTTAAPSRKGGLARRLWGCLARRRPTEADEQALNTALILMADHELAASTAAVRIAASFRADPYAAVSAGLAVVSGDLHGRTSTLVSQLLDLIEQERSVEQVVGRWLVEGRRIPGLGLSVYPDGDPRASYLFDLTEQIYPESLALSQVKALLEITKRQGFPPPNVDMALAVLTRSMHCEAGAAEVIFTVARIAGWLAHVAEEYTERTHLRLRALYTGPRP